MPIDKSILRQARELDRESFIPEEPLGQYNRRFGVKAPSIYASSSQSSFSDSPRTSLNTDAGTTKSNSTNVNGDINTNGNVDTDTAIDTRVTSSPREDKLYMNGIEHSTPSEPRRDNIFGTTNLKSEENLKTAATDDEQKTARASDSSLTDNLVQQDMYEQLLSAKQQLRAKDDIISSLKSQKLSEIAVRDQEEKLEQLEAELLDLKKSLARKESELESRARENEELTRENLHLDREYKSMISFVRSLRIFDIDCGSVLMDRYSRYTRENQVWGSIQLDELLGERLIEATKRLPGIVADSERLKVIEERLDNLVQSNATLEKTEYQNWRSSLSELTDLKEALLQLGDKSSTESTKQGFRDFQDKISNEINEKHSEIVDLLSTKDEYLNKLNTQRDIIEKKSSELRDLEALYKEEIGENQRLQSSISKLKGSSTKRVVYEDFRAPGITKDLYDSLKLEKIDHLNMTELQNILKELCVGIETPFDKILRKIRLANMLIRKELVILVDFANHLYYYFFKRNLAIQAYTEEAYRQYVKTMEIDSIRHPLKSVLDRLFDRIKLELQRPQR